MRPQSSPADPAALGGHSADCYLAVRSRCLHPGQQQGRRWPSSPGSLLGAANTTLPGHLLLGVFDPADELVPGQRRDVLPRVECGGVGDQRVAQVSWKLVHLSTGHSAAHRARVAGQGGALMASEASPGPGVHRLGGPGRSIRAVAYHGRYPWAGCVVPDALAAPKPKGLVRAVPNKGSKPKPPPA